MDPTTPNEAAVAAILYPFRFFQGSSHSKDDGVSQAVQLGLRYLRRDVSMTV